MNDAPLTPEEIAEGRRRFNYYLRHPGHSDRDWALSAWLVEHADRLLSAAERPHETRRWNIEPGHNGTLQICRGNHPRGSACEWEKLVPAERLAEREQTAARREAENIIYAIRSTTWSGSEEIVEMIRRRHASRHPKEPKHE